MKAAYVIGDPRRLRALCALWREEGVDVWLTLQGESMCPTIRPGSRLRLRFGSQEPVPGEVAAFLRDGYLVVHRLQRELPTADGERLLIFKGDGNPEPDEPVRSAAVVGVVAEVRKPAPSYRLRKGLRAWRWRFSAKIRRRMPGALFGMGRG